MDAYLIQVVDYLLSQSWQIAILAVAAALTTFLLRHRSAHVHYPLWLIVLAKCLVPPLSRLSGFRCPTMLSRAICETYTQVVWSTSWFRFDLGRTRTLRWNEN